MSKIAMASDHAAFNLKELVKSHLMTNGHEVVDFGTYSDNSCDYADYAHPAALSVETGDCDFGVAMCGSGNGVQMTLNKHQGIRAALCWIPELGTLAKQHNNANFLVLPARFISDYLAIETVDAYMFAEFEGGRHLKRIEKIPAGKWEE